MQSHDSVEDSNASSSSLSYYIPGITAKPRCLADDVEELRAMTSSSLSSMMVVTPASTPNYLLTPEHFSNKLDKSLPRVTFQDDLFSPSPSSTSSLSFGKTVPNVISPSSPESYDDNSELNNSNHNDAHAARQQQQQHQRQRRRRNEPTLTSFFRMEALRRSIEMEQRRVQQLQEEWDRYLGDDDNVDDDILPNSNAVPMEIAVNHDDDNDDPLATPPPLPRLVFRLEEPDFSY